MVLPARIAAWFDWCFRDRRTGQITIAQLPNLPLGIFLGTVVLRWFVSTGRSAGTVIQWVGAGALSWWAVDELVRGVNPWRRLLGLGGVVFAATEAAALLR